MLCAAAPVKASESKNKVSAAAAAPSSTTPATPAKADTPAVTAAAEYVVRVLTCQMHFVAGALAECLIPV